jgi:dTMP kinase
MGQALQARMRAGFLDLARAHPARFRVIDGAGAPDAVAARVLAAFDAGA